MSKNRHRIFTKRSKPSLNQASRIACLLSCISLLLLTSCGGGGGSESAGLVSTDPGPGGSIGTDPGKATLSWDAPTANADGTPLTDLAGFKVYYGTSSPITKENSQSIDAKNTTTYTLDGLNLGTYYFVVTAVDKSGNESGYSNEVNKIIY